MKSFLLRARAYAAAATFGLSILSVSLPQAVLAFAGGDGTEGSPYQVATCTDLTDVNNDLAAYYVLTADLDCSADGNTIMIASAGSFNGHFDGAEHTITIDLDVSGQDNVGLFGEVNGGTISNLSVAGTVDAADSGYNAGMVAGRITSSTITDVHSSGTINALPIYNVGGLIGGTYCESVLTDVSSSATVSGLDYVGGLSGNDGCEGPGSAWTGASATGTVTGNQYVGGAIGGAYYTDLTDVHATGEVTGTDYVGGLVGEYVGSTRYKVFHSYASGDVNGVNRVGGLIGSSSEMTISQTYSLGDVASASGSYAGGLIGYVEDMVIRDTYARGNVAITDASVESYAGGLIGFTSDGNVISTSYATGTVAGAVSMGGVLGINDESSLYSVFWDTQTSSMTDGCSDDCSAVGKNTSQMTTASTFTGASWNFDTIWDIDAGQNDSYPILLGGDDESLQSVGSGNPIETILAENQFHGTGIAQGWNDDDNEWEYELPFTFNFYGEDYTSVYVSSNGYVSFGGTSGNYDFDITSGADYPLIVAMSGDLDTDCGNEGEDIYIDDDTEGMLIFRWQAADHRECDTLLNFEIVLHSDNSFEINYGDMSADLDGNGSVGVHNGVDSFRASEYSGRLNFDELNTSAWNWTPAEETDSDGVDDSEEAAAPNGGDANDDGIADDTQTDVSSLVSPVSGKYVVLEAGSCSANESVSLVTESTDSTQDDDGYAYPAGLLDFTLTGCGVGATETITQYYYGDYDISKVAVRKYDEVTHSYTTISSAVVTAVVIGGQNAVKVVYQVTDGGSLDDDGTANGTIVDPAGLAVLAAVTAPSTGFASYNIQQAIALVVAGAGVLVTAIKFSGRTKRS